MSDRTKRVYVHTHDAGEYSFSEDGIGGGWAKRGPIDLPKSLIGRYEEALARLRAEGRKIDALIAKADLDD